MSLVTGFGLAKLVQLAHKNSVKKIGTGLILLVVLTTIISGPRFGAAGHAFSSGSGTAVDPYVISDCTELQAIDDEVENLYAHYVLGGDVDCSGVPSFETIANYNDFTDTYLPFRGWLNGQGHTISNVSVGTAGTQNNGIFASIQGASIRNLNLDNITVTGSSYLGTLVGEADHSALIGISVTNSTITSQNSSGQYIGGLVGRALTSSLYGISVATTTVTATYSASTSDKHFGGIVGNLNGFSAMERSRSQATVTANVSTVGGLVGSISYGSTITNSYSNGVVTGYDQVGGVTGAYYRTGVDSYIDSTYSNASTTATFINATAGGINGGSIGGSSAELHISNSFAVGRVSSTTFSGGISGASPNLNNTVYYPAGTTRNRCTGTGGVYSALECTSNNSSAYYNSRFNAPLAQWNFTNVWAEVPGARPILNVFPYTEPAVATTIATCGDLSNNVIANPVGWFELANDVNCADDGNYAPLNGNATNSPPFHGILDGQGFIISGVAATYDSSTQYQSGLGLFSRLYGATIRDINLEGTGMAALSIDVDRVGGLAGTGMAVMVTNATSSVPSRTGGQFGGGLIGYASGEFSNINVFSDIDSVDTEPAYLGGLIGFGGGYIKMDSVSFSGTVTGYNIVGGILGLASFFEITNATSSGTLISGGRSGGIVGISYGSFGYASLIDGAYSDMTQFPNYAVDSWLVGAGGIVGSAGGTSILNSRYDGTINIGLGFASDIGGIVGTIGANVEGMPSMVASSSASAYITALANGNDPYIENIGGLVGKANDVVISTSSAFVTMNLGSDTTTNYIDSFLNIGGLVGYGNGSLQINNVEASGSITIYEDVSSASGFYGYGLGGLIGASYDPSIINNATSGVDILLYSYEPGGVGGFAGELINATTTNIVTTGSVTIDLAESPYNIGGFVGYGSNLVVGTTTVLSDITLTDTSAPNRIAGFAGYLYNSSVYTTYTDSAISMNTGNATSTGANDIGGFLGQSFGSTLTDTYASTSVTITSLALNTMAASDVGGYAGRLLAGGNTITNAYSSGALTLIASSSAPYVNVGGFIGSSDSGTNSISNTFTVSAISSLASSTRVGGYIGSYNGGETFANNAYDVTRTSRTLCTGINGVDPLWCSAQNITNSTPTYFYTATNPPQSTWNFSEIWREYTNTYPTFGGGALPASSTSATVSTQAGVSSTTQTSGVVEGEITDVGSGTVTERGFVYGTTTSFGATTSQSSAGYSAGTFTQTLSGLTCATIYYFAAYASGSEGLVYGSTQSFVTSACTVPPSATSTPETNNSSGGSTKNNSDSKTIVRICQVAGSDSFGAFTFGSQTLVSVDSAGNLFDDTQPAYSNAIIPAFTYIVGKEVKTYAGKNLSLENQATYNNNCVRFVARTLREVPAIAVPSPQNKLAACDPENLPTLITSKLGNQTTVSITVPANSISSSILNAAGLNRYEVVVSTGSLDATAAATKIKNFTDLLARLENTDRTVSADVVKKMNAVTYTPPSSVAVTGQNAGRVNGVVEFVSSGPCQANRSLVKTTTPTPSTATISPSEANSIVGEEILDILPQIDVAGAVLLTEPFTISAVDERGNVIEIFEQPFPVTITNSNLPTNDAYIYIVKIDRDNGTWFEVPYVTDGDKIRITIEQPGEYFVWLLPKKANAFSGAVESVSGAPLFDFSLPAWLVRVFAFLGLSAGAVTFLAFISKIPFSVTNVRKIITQAAHNIFGLLTFRKKMKPWGTIYDSETKAPLDPVYVELFDEAGIKKEEAITDLDGRYGFLVPPGLYTMNVRKSNYLFPSVKLQSATRDIIYTNLYHGGNVSVTETVAYDIPMDAKVFDWNQYEKLRTKQTIFFSRLDVVMVRVLDILFFVGAIAMVLQFINAINLYTGLLALMYLILFVMRIYSGKPSLYGVITQGGRPLPYVIVKVFQQGREVTSRVTDDKGRYIALLHPGTYEITIEKRVSQDTFETVLEKSVQSKNGTLNVWLKVPMNN